MDIVKQLPAASYRLPAKAILNHEGHKGHEGVFATLATSRGTDLGDPSLGKTKNALLRMTVG